MQVKPCRKCGDTKPLSEYYRHKMMSDGHLNFCKECVKSRVHEHRERNIDRIREYDRNRPNKKDRNIKNRRRYQDAKNNPEQWARILEQSRAWAERNPEQRRVNWTVGNAIRDGKIKPQPCEVCGLAFRVHAHHEDYAKPLDITWLCVKHHADRHREINEERRRCSTPTP